MQLAQVNVARLRWAMDAPELRPFVRAVTRVNALAEASPGFVWRYPTQDVHAGVPGPPGEGDQGEIVVNLSVWESYPHLHAFTYRGGHGLYLRRRAEWFLPTPGPTTALWWVPAGRRPTPDEALARLRLLRAEGPSARAFGVRRRFTAEGRPEVSSRPVRSA